MPDDLTYRIKIDKDEALRDIREIRDEIQKSLKISAKASGSSSGRSKKDEKTLVDHFISKTTAGFNILGMQQARAAGAEMSMQELINFSGLRPAQQAASRALRAQQMTISGLGLGAGGMSNQSINDVNNMYSDILKMQDEGINSVLEATGGRKAFAQTLKNLMEGESASAQTSRFFYGATGQLITEAKSLLNDIKQLLSKFGF